MLQLQTAGPAFYFEERASAGSFHFRVLVAMKNVPAHARCASVAERILDSSCAGVEVTPPAVVSEEDDRFFVVAWCIHPRLIPDEKIVVVPEPLVRVDYGATELPALRYLVRCRVVEFQDWSVPRHTTDEDSANGRDDSSDDGDDNHNRRHPGLDDRGRRTSWVPSPCASSTPGMMHRPWAQAGGCPFAHARAMIVVGSLACPIPVSHRRQGAVPKSRRRQAAVLHVGPCAARHGCVCQPRAWKADRRQHGDMTFRPVHFAGQTGKIWGNLLTPCCCARFPPHLHCQRRSTV